MHPIDISTYIYKTQISDKKSHQVPIYYMHEDLKNMHPEKFLLKGMNIEAEDLSHQGFLA